MNHSRRRNPWRACLILGSLVLSCAAWGIAATLSWSLATLPPDPPKILRSPKDMASQPVRMSAAAPAPKSHALGWDWSPGAESWTNVQFEVQRRAFLASGTNWTRYALVTTNRCGLSTTGVQGAFRVRAGLRNQTNTWSDWNRK